MTNVDSLYYGKKPILEMKIGNNTFYKSPGWESPVGGLRLANTRAMTSSSRMLKATNKNTTVWQGYNSNVIEIRDNDMALLKSYSVPISNWYIRDIDTQTGIIIGASDYGSSSYRVFDSNLNPLNSIQNVLEAGRDYQKILSTNDGTIGLLVKGASIFTLIINPYTTQATRKNINFSYNIMSISTDGTYFYVLSGTRNPSYPNSYGYCISPFFISKVNTQGNVIGSTSFRLSDDIQGMRDFYAFDAVGNFFCAFDSGSSSYPFSLYKILTNGTVINAIKPTTYPWNGINCFSTDKFGNLFFGFNRPGNTYDMARYGGFYDNNLKNFTLIKGDGSSFMIDIYALNDGRVIVKQNTTLNWYEEVAKT